MMTFFNLPTQTVYGQASIRDHALNVESAVEGLSSPTSMAFLDDNNILVLEKEEVFAWFQMAFCREQPILQVPVSTVSERGLLGITVSNTTNDGQGLNHILY
jgi:aldose sugar dehydrogenase